MRKNKKLIMLLSFCLGAAIFITTAFADAVSTSGYEQLKDAFKHTTKSLSKDLDSFTLEAAYSLKDNNKVLVSMNATSKHSIKDNRKEDISTAQTSQIKETNYSFTDEKRNISYNRSEDTYYVYNYMEPNADSAKFDDPFDSEQFKDVEKIIDALLGNLRDHVIVSKNPDGSKEFSGSISDSQMPALVNAVSTYFFKQTITPGLSNSKEITFPELVNDIFIKSVSGRASVNNDGIIDNLFASFILSGQDKDGNDHEISLEAVFKVLNINETSVESPDLTDKKVVEKKVDNSSWESAVTEKYLGKWKCDIVLDDADKFVKIGEKYVEITSIDDKNVYGRYYEVILDENSSHAKNRKDFEFKAKIDEYRGGSFESTNLGDKKETGSVYFNPGLISFHISYVDSFPEYVYNSDFSKVFED
ncbi:MAG: hypothetical protein GX660_15700 [Clostridiaceae bacterium]|nr:hypothetical protein [Clostridiaceae bacterium]